jgi:hypothetical protein
MTGRAVTLMLLCGMTLMPALAQDRAAIAAASAVERQREMDLLGITAMQKGATAYDIGAPGNANYDEAKANPFTPLPALMVLKDGTVVTSPAQWQRRRTEIERLFDENVYGKYPARIPDVTWTVTGTEQKAVAGIPAIVKHVSGQVDNSAWPAISVTIDMDVVTPMAAKGRKVPVIIGGGSVRPRPVVRFPLGQAVHKLKMPDNPRDSAALLLRKGWGFVFIDYNGVQADNGAGLTTGIIGLINRGRPRALDEWGVLRAWAWADSRALDYLQTDPDVNAHAVGVMGHSRGGKAALVAMADDSRIAIGYISSSGAGGANLYRRHYGETIGNLAGTSEFHWFAGNFLRYAAAGHTADEMPVDAHEFIALVAPRPVFIGGGALITDPDYSPGDAWQDAKGMFMAAAAASPAWDVQGVKGLGTTTFPSMNTLVASSAIAYRQHAFGHTPAPNWPYFIDFASRYLKSAP